jgi:hypothetical protein
MHTRSPLISPSFWLNADSSSLNARASLAAAIALHSAKFKKMGFKGLSCRARHPSATFSISFHIAPLAKFERLEAYFRLRELIRLFS